MKTCKEVMTPDPRCCVAEDNVVKAAQLMKKENVGSIPVIESMATHQVRRIPVADDHNNIVGIISQGDVALRLNDHETTGEVVSEISE